MIFTFTFKNAEVRNSFFSLDSSESFISPKVKLKPSFFPFTVTDFVSFFAVSYYNRGKPGLPGWCAYGIWRSDRRHGRIEDN